MLLEKKWFVLLAWQFCSLMISCMSVSSSMLSHFYGRNLPFFQLFVTYVIVLSISPFLKKSTEIQWWKFALVAFLSILSDFLAIKSYNFTSLGSAQLLCTTPIIWVGPLSYIFFRRKMNLWQVFSILLAATGVVLVFLADGAGDSRWFGNLLACCSAMTYAIVTCSEEFLVSNADPMTYIFRIASCTIVYSLIGSAVTYKDIISFVWTWKSALLILAYAAFLSIYIFTTPVVIKHSNATVMNLSLLTGNFYSLGFSIILFHQKTSWLYLIGFFCIPIAIVIYTLSEKKPAEYEQLLVTQE